MKRESKIKILELLENKKESNIKSVLLEYFLLFSEIESFSKIKEKQVLKICNLDIKYKSLKIFLLKDKYEFIVINDEFYRDKKD